MLRVAWHYNMQMKAAAAAHNRTLVVEPSKLRNRAEEALTYNDTQTQYQCSEMGKRKIWGFWS